MTSTCGERQTLGDVEGHLTKDRGFLVIPLEIRCPVDIWRVNRRLRCLCKAKHVPLVIAVVLYLYTVITHHIAEALIRVRGVANFKSRAILLRVIGVLLARIAAGAEVAYVAVVVRLNETRGNILVAVERVVAGHLVLPIQHRGCRHQRAAEQLAFDLGRVLAPPVLQLLRKQQHDLQIANRGVVIPDAFTINVLEHGARRKSPRIV